MIDYLEDNDEIDELEDRFHTDIRGAVEDYFYESLQEGAYGNKGAQEWQDLPNKKSKQDKEEEESLWDRVYAELATENGPYEIKAPKWSRYEKVFQDPDGIGVHAADVKDLDFAQQVADYFGLEIKKVREPGNAGTETAWKGVILIPEDMVDETPEETEARLGKK